MIAKILAKAISKKIADNWATGQKRSVQVSRTDSNLKPETVSEMEKIIFNKTDIEKYKNNFEDKTFKKSNEVEKEGIKKLSKDIEVDENEDIVKNSLSDMKKFKKDVEQQHPYSYIETTPRVPSHEQQVGALPSGQVEGGKLRIYNTDKDVTNMGKTFRGLVGLNVKIADGVTVGSRFDIRAYENFAEFISTLHAPQHSGKVIGYARTAIIENVDLSMRKERKKNLISANISKGFKKDKTGTTKLVAKSPFVKMEGQWKNHDSLQLRENVDAFLKGTEPDLLGGTNWVRVSVNPSKGATFVQVTPNKKLIKSKKHVEGKTPTISAPLVGASRIIQIGKLVLAENPKLFNEKVVLKKANEIIKKLQAKGIDVDQEEIIANLTWKEYYKAGNFNEGGNVKNQTQKLLQEGGLNEEGGTVDPISGNNVPVGSTQEEVRDDIPAQLSEGEFVFPADVVRFIGLNNLMKLRQEAKEGLGKMDRMGQMGNSEEATEDDTGEFDSDIDSIIEEVEAEMATQESPKDTIEEPEDTIEEPEDSDLKKKIEEGVTGFAKGGFASGGLEDGEEKKELGQTQIAYLKGEDAKKLGLNKYAENKKTVDPTINEELPPTEKPKTVNEQVRDYRSPFAMKRLDPTKGMPDTESSQIGRSLLGKKGFTSARDLVSKKFPDIVDPTKDPNTSTKVGTSTTNKTQQTKVEVEKDFSTFISGPKDYTNLTGDDAKSNIMNQLQHQNEYLKRQGQSYPKQKDQPFINQYMADSLAQAGIKDLRQLGYKDIEQPKASVNLIRKGNKYYYDSVSVSYNSSNLYKTDKEKQATLIEVPASEVKKIEGRSLGMGIKDTKFTAMIEQPPKRMLINKDTGEEVVQGKYGGELNKPQDTTREIGYGMRSEKEPVKNLEEWKSLNDPKKGVRWGNTVQTEGMTNFMIKFDENDNALIYPNYVDTKNDGAEKFAIAAAIAAGITYAPHMAKKYLTDTVKDKLKSTVKEKLKSTVKDKLKSTVVKNTRSD